MNQSPERRVFVGDFSEEETRIAEQYQTRIAKNLKIVIEILAVRNDAAGIAAIKAKKLLEEGRATLYTTFDLASIPSAYAVLLCCPPNDKKVIPAIVFNGAHKNLTLPPTVWGEPETREVVRAILELPIVYMHAVENLNYTLVTQEEFFATYNLANQTHSPEYPAI